MASVCILHALSVPPRRGGQTTRGTKMIARLVCVVSFSVVSLACALPARADWISEFFHGMARDTKRRNCWPKPFVCPDRLAVRQPFALMISNGWRYQNMLGDHYFVDDSGALTEAGRIKVHWILTEAPRHHREIYVYRGTSPDETAARIENVRRFAVLVLPEGQMPAIFESEVPPLGWPAARVDSIGRKFDSSAPEPRLPSSSGAGAGGN